MCLATTKAGLSFEGLTSVSLEVARSLAPHRAELRLCGLRRMPAKTAECLANHKGDCLVLDGVDSLAPSAAAALAAHSGRLSLRGLHTLDRKCAQALACHVGTLVLPLHLEHDAHLDVLETIVEFDECDDEDCSYCRDDDDEYSE